MSVTLPATKAPLLLGGGALLVVGMLGCAAMQSSIPTVSPAMVATAAGREATPEALESGRRILAARCIACHGLEPVQKFSPDQWHSIVGRMAERAQLSSREREQLTSYLVAARQSLP